MAKVWFVPNKSVNNHLTVGCVRNIDTRVRPVLYSLYRKDPFSKTYKRIRTTAYPEKIAFRVFREAIIAEPLSLSLRPIKIECFSAQ